ncbi:MAG: hypothetical protein RL757_2030 [Bacteroidota bacterium]|jgi:hypothetical protein
MFRVDIFLVALLPKMAKNDIFTLFEGLILGGNKNTIISSIFRFFSCLFQKNGFIIFLIFFLIIQK